LGLRKYDRRKKKRGKIQADCQHVREKISQLLWVVKGTKPLRNKDFAKQKMDDWGGKKTGKTCFFQGRRDLIEKGGGRGIGETKDSRLEKR